MRQRYINWNAARRDMQRYRSPEQMLIREMLEALKDLLETGFNAAETPSRQRARAVIAKAERHTNG